MSLRGDQLLLVWNAPSVLLTAFLILIVAYAIFSLMGFGTALLASAPLAWVMPVAQVIPLLALMDGVSAVQRGYRARSLVDRASLRHLLPGMLLGQVIGVALLARLPLSVMALLLGTFVTAYGAWGLRSTARTRASAPGMTWVYGVLGGLFGSGGFVYAACLQARLADRNTFRATQAVMISISTIWRIGLCALSGLIDTPLLLTALVLLPAAWLGMKLGAQADKRLTDKHLAKALHGLLIVSGLSLIGKGLY